MTDAFSPGELHPTRRQFLASSGAAGAALLFAQGPLAAIAGATGGPPSFTLNVPDSVLADLQERLRRAQFAPDFANADWRYGVRTSYLRDFVRYWRDEYDWRREERRINRFNHHLVEIDGMPIHFIREPGVGPSPIPIVLCHGWPWTFWDFRQVIRPLADPGAFGGDPADAFDVIVPSLPGFGFSSPITTTGVNYWVTADIWVKLMRDVLGYSRFASHGGDYGALISAQLGHKYADLLYGIHLTDVAVPGVLNIDRPWAEVFEAFVDAVPPELRDEAIAWEREHAAHFAEQIIEPQTIAQALHDSPSGLAAWLLQRRFSWGDTHGDVESVFDRDFLITSVMLYWVTNSFVASARFYYEGTENKWTPSHDGRLIEAPTGLSSFAGDAPPGFSTAGLEFVFNLVYTNSHAAGGHFAPEEQPAAVVADIREMFRPLRG